MVIRAKPGTQPTIHMRVRQRCKRPVVGSLIMARPSDAWGNAAPGAKWARWLVRAIEGDLYLLEAW